MKKPKQKQQVALFEGGDKAATAEIIKGAALTPAAERLLANFEVLAEAPGGIQRLRQLILELAVRGKLLPQDIKDESSAEVLKQVEAKRHRLFTEGKTTRLDPLPEVDLASTPFVVPDGWIWARLGSVTICRDAQRIPVSKEQREGRRGPYDYYGASGVIDHVDSYIFDESLLLIGEDGANLISRSTPIAFIAHGKYWVNNHAHVLDAANLDALHYMAIFVNAIDLKPYVTGTAQPKLNQAKMNAILVALPPLAEQARIVAKVDELMAICDEMKARQTKRRGTAERLNKAALGELTSAEGPEELAASLQRVVENFEALVEAPEGVKRLREHILELAVRGKLAAQNVRIRQTATAAVNLDPDDLTQKADGPYILPTGWFWTTVDVLYDVSGGIQKTPRRAPVQNHFPYLRVENVQRGRLDFARIERFELFDDELTKCRLEIGDILIVEGNGSEAEIGRCAIWDGSIADCVHQNHIIRCRPKNRVTSLFTVLFFNSPSGMSEMRRLAITTSGLYSLSVGKIRSILVPNVPLAEQARTVAKVDHLRAICDTLEAKIRAADEGARRLAESLVAELMA